jgi:hypothetical protein
MHDEILSPRQVHNLPVDGKARLHEALGIPGFEAVGCKLHAYQPLQYKAWDDWEHLWRALSDDATIKVVVVRRDELAQLGALKMAMRQNDWTGNTELSGERVQIDPHEFYWFRRWNQLAYDVRLSQLQGHERMTITYESLVQNWSETLTSLFDFLNVLPVAAERIIWGRNAQSLVENWQELV